MSAEDRAAQPLTPELYEAVIRAARETAREEVRAALDARASSEKTSDYVVPSTIAGVPV
jgi:hypothetical protein